MNDIIGISIFLFGLFILFLNTLLFVFLKNKTRLVKIMNYYLIASCFEGVVCFSLAILFQVNNFFLNHIFFTIQLLFLGFFFYNLFEVPIQKKYVKISSIVVFLVAASQYAINPSSFWHFNLIEIFGVSCLIISFALLHIYNTLGQKKDYFYFCLGMIMYFLCSCIVYLCGNISLVFNEDPYIDHWVIKDLFFIVYQLLILKEYFTIKREKFVRK